MSGTHVMNFGPQWIRSMTNGVAPSSTASSSSTSTTTTTATINSTSSSNNFNSISTSSSSSTSNNTNNNNSASITASQNSYNAAATSGGKYKLAEYRYGREEMLALFEQDVDAPEDIKKFTDLFIEKARMPMAMTPMTEEELKVTSRTWNSDAVLRSSNKMIGQNVGAGGPNSIAGGPGSLGMMGGSALNDRDSRQMSDRGPPGSGSGTLTAAGVLSSSPRGPPGSLSRLPEQKGLLSSLNTRGQSAIRNLVNRGPLYMRSQSHEDDPSVEDSVGGAFDSRFGMVAGQPAKQPNSLRARFDNSRVATGSVVAGVGHKPLDPKLGGGGSVELGEVPVGGRSVFDRLPNKYSSVDDKTIRKDINGRPIQSSADWRQREWSGSGGASGGPPDSMRGGAKVQADDRSWRSSRAGAAEDWRSGGNSGPNTNSSSWYVRTDDQRNPRTNSGQNQDNMIFKRDTLRRPSIEDGKDGNDVSIDGAQHSRHRRDSLPEWSMVDPLSGGKIGSFDASGAFREIPRDDGSGGVAIGSSSDDREKQETNKIAQQRRQDKSQRQATGFEIKPTGDTNEQEWRSNQNRERVLNGVDTLNSSIEFEKLSLAERDKIPHHDAKQQHLDDKRDLKARTTPSSLDKEHQKSSFDNSRNSTSPTKQQQHQLQQIPESLRQILEKHSTRDQQQSLLAAMASGNPNAILRAAGVSNEDDGFAHLERATEMMVAQWSAEEEHDPSSVLSALKNRSANDIRLFELAQRQQQQQQQQQQSSDSANSSGPPAQANIDSTSQQKKMIILPFNHENSQQWFYRDTQDVIQGPFSASEMCDWYKAGYFVKELPIRRYCDETFYPLGDSIKMWDRIPFAPLPMNVPTAPPVTAQAIIQFRNALTKQLEMAAANQRHQQIPANAAFALTPGAVMLRGPMVAQPVAAMSAANAGPPQGVRGPDQADIIKRQLIEAARQQDPSNAAAAAAAAAALAQQRIMAAGGPVAASVPDQAEMQTQLRQLLAQLKSREGFSNLNAQEQEVLFRQYVASQQAAVAASTGMPAGLTPDQSQQQQQVLAAAAAHQQAQMMQFLPLMEHERLRQQQRLEMERRQKEEVEKQGRLIMEQRLEAEKEKQRIMDEMQKRQQKQKEAEMSEKQRQTVEKERLIKLNQLKQQQQQQMAKQQQEELIRQQMQSQQQQHQRLQQEKSKQRQQPQQQQPQQASVLTPAQQQQQQIERAKKAAQAQQIQQEQQQQQRKTAWSTVSKPDQEPVSLATLQKIEEAEKEREREKQRQQQMQTNQQLQLQRQMTWATAAQQQKAAAPIKTLAEIQKEEEERLAKEQKQKKTKVQPSVASAGVWNNAAMNLSWKNPPADSS